MKRSGSRNGTPMRSPVLLVAGALALASALPGLAGLGLIELAAPAQAAAPTEGAPPPYDGDLMRLAEILGALHYLRPLCGVAAESQRWRNEMQALIDTEQPSDARKAKIISSFNHGYSSYAEVYRTCTAAARVAVERQLDEGSRLAHDIVVRYGGN